MSNNFLPPPKNPDNPGEPPKRRTGLLSGYTEQQGQQPQPGPFQPLQSAEAGNVVPPNAQYQGPPTRDPFNQGAPQRQLPPPQQPAWRGPSFIAGPVQMVQRWSNKMQAMRQPAPTVDPNPLVRYRNPAPVSARPERAVQTRSEPWKRSRTTKITHLMRKRRERAYKNGSGSQKVAKIIGSIVVALLIIIVASGGISSYAYYQSQLPQLSGVANMQINQSSRIYDRNGNLLATIYNQKYGRSTPVAYPQIPGFMQDAQIATEDKTFWTNDGVDVQATLRSALIDSGSQSVQTGASTLTQQLIKNMTGNDQTNGLSGIQRKLSEAALAIGLTQEYPKWKILEMYFNIAPYGAQEQGLAAAAEDFFGLTPTCDANFNCTPAVEFLDRDLTKCKNPKDDSTCAVEPLLGLARASLIAGIPQNPVTYDPLTNPGNFGLLLQRQDYVLNQMMANGMSINIGLGSQVQDEGAITPQVIAQVEAMTKQMQNKFAGFNGGNKAPDFVRWVIQTLANSLGGGNYSAGLNILDDSGLNIKTTLDLNLETYVEAAEYRHIDEPEVQAFQEYKGSQILSHSDNLHDSATVVMDAKTGEVLAMDGSINWNDPPGPGSGQTDMASSPRQPGSAFKPIVMAAAYEDGFYPGIVLPDQKTYLPQGLPQSTPADALPYIPHDYSGGYTDSNTNIELAISNSYNIPAIKASYYAGYQSVANMAERLGITTINQLVPSMALGVNPVSLMQMVDAYQTFANQGTRIPPQNILAIWDNYGHQLYQYNPSNAGTRVLSQQIAYLLTSTLDNEVDRAAEFENDHVLSMWDWTLPDGSHPDVATKTGTTDSFKDNWTIGYTPDVVVGVWSGNADNTKMVNSIGVTGAAPIWHSVIEYASGRCNTNSPFTILYGNDADQIPCPPLDLNYTDRHFTTPSGIVQQQVNTVNGLAGSGYDSTMIDGEQPQQAGLNTSCPTTGDTTNQNNGTGSTCTSTNK